MITKRSSLHLANPPTLELPFKLKRFKVLSSYYIQFAIELAMRTSEFLVLDLVASPVWKLGKICME